MAVLRSRPQGASTWLGHLASQYPDETAMGEGQMEDVVSGVGTSAGSGDSSGEAAPQPVDEKLQKLLDKALYGGGTRAAQQLRNFLNGTWLGQPLHVVLTDVPIGAWTMAMVFDGLELATGRRKFARAADIAIAVGLFGAAGAAVTGLTDWSDVDPPARRVGFLHGLLNVGGTTCFLASLLFRKSKSRSAGRIASALGYAIMTYAAHLGGEMVYEHRVGVNRTSGQKFPEEYVAVLPEAALAESKPTRVSYQGTPILLVRRGERVFAMAETCSHFSGPLSEGKLEGDSIVCPYHFSRFALSDGRVINGPAVHPQPCLDVRVRDGNIEVRKAPADDSRWT
jgi:nitrite reductase/ring-hydroxylating ferredoxin subunit/uncharacterized membrane protein